MSDVPTPTTSLALDEINPGSFDFWLRDDVDGALARLRRERPIAWHQHPDSGRGFWSLTRFDDIVAASRDWETFSSAYGIQVLTDPEDTDRIAIRSMISTDPPKHTKLRSIVNRGFTPRMVAKAEDSVRRRAREIVDAIAPKGRVEFVSEVSAALPVAIICDMVGVPETDRPRVGSFILLLIAAGNETTRNAISHGLWALTQFPDEKRRWLQDLEGHAITAAEEIVRWGSPVMHMRRTLTRDVTFGGVEMLKGAKVAMWYISANRDEAHFKDPYRFDITREPNHQGGFGTGGPHFCLGSHLARREVVVMMTELLRRLPDIEATGKPEKLRSNFVHGIKRLPAAFKPV